MQITYPHYIRRFSCAAGQCPDTCCAGWQIVIDEKTREKYQEAPGAMGERLRASIRGASFRQRRGRCEFLNKENLCDIYTELGEAYFCETCRTYPRHIEEFENVREISLSLSCPVAAELIVGCREKTRFLTEQEERPEESYRDFDFFLYDKLLDARQYLIRILQDRKRTVPERMAAALAYSHDVQARIQRRQVSEIDALTLRYKRPEAWEALAVRWKCYEGRVGEKWEQMQKMMACLNRLEVLKENFPRQVKGYRHLLYSHGKETYERERKEFEEYCREHSLDTALEQLLVYFIYTYFCGAVYDGNAYAKVKLALVSTLFIREWAMAQWMRNGKLLRIKDLAEISSAYSRELEHSDKNLSRMEDMLSKNPLFSLEHLMICMLN